MITRPRIALLTIIGALALAPAAGAVVVGIADQGTAMFSSPLFLKLKVKEVRITVPWNVAASTSQRAELAHVTAWLKDASADGVTPLVSFGGSGNFIPTAGEYTSAVGAFIHKFPAVKRYSPWNEPDWIYRPALATNPKLAAAYYNALVASCRGCTVLAGDVYLAAPQLKPWLMAYEKGLHYRPAGWALHNYYDVRSHAAAQLQALLSVTSGPIWLDEISGVERRGHWPYPNQSMAAAARDEQFLFSLSQRFPRISRIYHYQWEASPRAGWDSGLIGANGKPRPAYQVVATAAG
jgi:hypothetical protein